MEDSRLPIENSIKASGKPAKTPKRDDTRDDHLMEEAIGQEDATMEKYNKRQLQFPKNNLQELLRYIRRSLRSKILPKEERIKDEDQVRVIQLSRRIMKKLAKCLDIDISDLDNFDVLLKVSYIIVIELWDSPKARILKGFFSLLPSSNSKSLELEIRDKSHLLHHETSFSIEHLTDLKSAKGRGLAHLELGLLEIIGRMLRGIKKLFEKECSSSDSNVHHNRGSDSKDTKKCVHNLITLQCTECGTKKY